MLRSNLYLILYIFLWALTCWLYWKKRKTFNSGFFVLISYLLYAICSFVLYNDYWLGGRFGELELFPFIYLYAILFVFLLPVLRYNEKCKIQEPSMWLLDGVSVFYIVLALISILDIIGNIQEGIFMILTTSDGGADLYDGFHSSSSRTATSPISNFFYYFSDIYVLVFFYYLTLPKKRKLIVLGGAFCIVIHMLQSFASGQRTTAVMTFLLLISTFFLLRSHLTGSVLKTTKYIGAFISVFVLLVVLAINTSRYSSKIAGENMYIIEYVGQENLYFNKYGLDAGGLRYGDRTCNLFKKWLGFSDVPTGIQDTRYKHREMKLDDSRFSTFVGDFSLDFGPVITAIFLCSFSIIVCFLTKVKHKTILFHQLLLIFFVLAVSIQGGMYLFYYSFGGNYTVLGFLMFYLLFKWDYDVMKHKTLKGYGSSKKLLL